VSAHLDRTCKNSLVMTRNAIITTFIWKKINTQLPLNILSCLSYCYQNAKISSFIGEKINTQFPLNILSCLSYCYQNAKIYTFIGEKINTQFPFDIFSCLRYSVSIIRINSQPIKYLFNFEVKKLSERF
jgi:hypothetical protein